MSTIDGLTVEERGRPENGLFACDRDDCNEMKARLTAAEARIRELKGALREIACRPCEGPPDWPDCPNATSGRGLWCSECIARAALAPTPGDEKRGGNDGR